MELSSYPYVSWIDCQAQKNPLLHTKLQQRVFGLGCFCYSVEASCNY